MAVMSADPNRVPDAQVIAGLTYNEAMELAYFGAKVLHPQTMSPAVESDIPIMIRNTFNPDAPGSRIASDNGSSRGVKGVTSIDDVALVNLEGAGMIGVPGTADRLFGALRNAGNFGHSDIAGELRALDMLCGSESRRRTSRTYCSSGISNRVGAKINPER